MRPPRQLPNALTLARLCCAPVVIVLAMSGDDAGAFWVLLAAGLSDGADGALARLTGTQSLLGSYLDAIADKVLLDSLYVSLALLGSLDARLAVLVVSRDAVLAGGSGLDWARGRRTPLRPLVASKVNTVMQIGLAAEVLAHRGLGWFSPWLAPVLEVVVAATTLYSGLAYAFIWWVDPDRHRPGGR